MKHNFNLIPNHYTYTIDSRYNKLIIHQVENSTYIDINLIENIEDGKYTVDIKIKSGNIYIWYSLYKEHKYIHCSVINLTN